MTVPYPSESTPEMPAGDRPVLAIEQTAIASPVPSRRSEARLRAIARGSILLAVAASAGCTDDSAWQQSAPAAVQAIAGQSSAAGTCQPIGAQQHPIQNGSANHIAAPLAASAYISDPPSSGPHCEAWGRYRVHPEAQPLPACNYVHNLEHGAVVLLYNCPAGCSEVRTALERIIASAPPDPDCGGRGIQRLILTPYADMKATVAAVAWGRTWSSTCWVPELESPLMNFIVQHWGSRGEAPEAAVCNDGTIGP